MKIEFVGTDSWWDLFTYSLPLGEVNVEWQYQNVKHKNLVSKETFEINERYVYYLYKYILNLLVPSFDEPNQWLLDTKLYLYYLYAVIITSQKQCILIDTDLKSSDLLEKLKNTTVDWKEKIELVRQQNDECYKRFLIYESKLKSILNIPLEERNINKLTLLFPTFSQLTDQQINEIREFILNPIFYGYYKDIFKGPFKIINCNINENNCELAIIEKFPYPYPYKEFPIQFAPDFLVPIILANSVARGKKQGYTLMEDTIESLDWVMSKFTGTDSFWTYKLGNKVETTANSASKALSNANQALKDAYNKVTNIYHGTSAVPDSLASILYVGGLAIGIFAASKLLSD